MRAGTELSSGDVQAEGGLSTLDQKLGALLVHAELLRTGACVPVGPAIDVPPWPSPPARVRTPVARRAAVVGAIVCSIVVAPHTLGAAELVFGSPPRPTLSGHKVGSPWHDPLPNVPSTPGS